MLCMEVVVNGDGDGDGDGDEMVMVMVIHILLSNGHKDRPLLRQRVSLTVHIQLDKQRPIRHFQ